MDIPFEAYEGTEPYIFVSYAHADKNKVYPEIKRLYEAGYRIWYDEGIPPASEWPEEVAKAIETCTFFLVFISPCAVQSKYVLNEIHHALKKNKVVLAIHIEATKLPSGLEFEIGRFQAIMKFKLSYDQYYRKLVKTLSSSLKKAIPPVITPTSPHLTPSKPASVEYQGFTLLSTEADVLMELEHILKKPIPEVSSIDNDTFGFTTKNEQVTGLGLYKQNLTFSPINEPIKREDKVDRLLESYLGEAKFLTESLFQLTNLQALNLRGNQFRSLTNSFGNLTKLKTLWLQENELESIPESVKELEKRGCKVYGVDHLK